MKKRLSLFTLLFIAVASILCGKAMAGKISSYSAGTPNSSVVLIGTDPTTGGTGTTRKYTIGSIMASPGAIGGTTPAAGSFTSVTASGADGSRGLILNSNTSFTPGSGKTGLTVVDNVLKFYNNGGALKDVGSGAIDDENQTTTTTYSSDKIAALIAAASGAAPTVQADDPTSSSDVGWYLATTSGDAFYKTAAGLFNISAGTYTADPTAPNLVSATVGADGETVTLVFDKNVSVGSGGSSGFALNNPTSALTYVSGGGTDTLTLTSADIILSTDAPGLDYTQPGNGIEATTGGHDLASITNAAVTNDSEMTELTCGTTANYQYATLDSYTIIGQDHYSNAFVGAQWVGSTKSNVCGVSFYLATTGDVSGITYEARIYSGGLGAAGTLKATSGSISGASLVNGGFNKFSFSGFTDLNLNDYIVVCRTDPQNESSSNYIRLNHTYTAHDGTDPTELVISQYSGDTPTVLDRKIALRLFVGE